GVKLATSISDGPVNVELAGVAKSTCILKNASVVLVLSASRKFGEPVGGGVGPSRSEARRPPMSDVVLKHCWVADAPVSILTRSAAHTRAPAKVLFGNML